MKLDSIERDVLQFIEAEMDAGLSFHEACAKSLSEIKRRGWAIPFLELLGSEAIRNFYRTRIVVDRREAIHRDPGPGPRKVDFSVLEGSRTLLESRWEVGGRYLRLGDCTRDDCLTVAKFFGELERSNVRRRKAFEALARRLRPGQRVRERFTERTLRRLFREGEES